MELPNTKGVYFMPKIYLDSNERLFLFDSLSKMENELRKMDRSLPTEQQNEFLEVIRSVYGKRGCNLHGNLFMAGNVIKPETSKHPKVIMEICMEFAFLHYAKLKNDCLNEYFARFDFIFDQFAVSRKDYKELLKKIGDRLCTEGPNSFIQKYKDMIVDEKQLEGLFDINIPEIIIPAHTIEVDVSDKNTFKNWSAIEDKINDLMSEIVRPKSGCTEEEISSVFSNLIDNIYTQLGKAEEKYEELKQQEEDEEDDDE